MENVASVPCASSSDSEMSAKDQNFCAKSLRKDPLFDRGRAFTEKEKTWRFNSVDADEF
jgi:hypothetical protein